MQMLSLNLFFYFLEMQRAMQNCVENIKVLSFVLDVVFDIKEWLTPHVEKLHDHTQPKCFKFVRNSSGKCEMFYRNYSHMPWEGPVILLKVHVKGCFMTACKVKSCNIHVTVCKESFVYNCTGV